MNASDWVRFFLAGWGIFFTAYCVVQIAVVIRLRGLKRLWSLAPVPIMLFVFFTATSASSNSDANLWPIWLITLSAVSVICLLALARTDKKIAAG